MLSKIDAGKLEQAAVAQVSEQVLTPSYLQWMIGEVRHSFSAEQLEKQIGEKQAYIVQLDRAISSLVDAIERTPATSLSLRLAEREEERQLLKSEIAALAAKQRYYQSLRIDDETLDILIDELRKGLLADRHTVRETIRRVVTKVEIKNDGGTLYLTLPRQSCLLVPPREFESLSPP